MSEQGVSDYGYDCHRCDHCPNLNIDIRNVRPKSEIVISYYDLINAIKEKCRFYVWMFVILRNDVRSLIKGLLQDQKAFGELPPEKQTMLSKCSSESMIDQLGFLSPYHGVTIEFELKRGTMASISSPILSSFTQWTKISIHYNLRQDLYPLLRKDKPVPNIFLAEKPVETSWINLRIFALSDVVERDGVKSLQVSNRPHHNRLSAYSSLSLARHWLKECTLTHKECRTLAGYMPKRVLDVRPDSYLIDVKLHTTLEGQSDPYAALTYCWGGDQLVKATEASMSKLKAGFDLELLPKTIQDAVCVTRGLGLRYLWVDCLCIIQDDEEDLAWEISNMASVFLGVTITISASSANASTVGFLDTDKRTCVELKSSVLRSSIFPATSFSLYMEWGRQYSAREEPLATRAWTLQERVLSTRLLDYCKEGMWWVCHTEGRSEDGPFGGNGPPTSFYHPPGVLSHRHPGDMRSLEDSVFANGRYQPTPFAAWRDTVSRYTKRNMTFGKDKLLAISGIAAEYGKLFQSEYLAGLWQFAFISELSWYVDTSSPRIPRPRAWRAPSWSWAAIDGAVAGHRLCISKSSTLVVHEANAQPVSAFAPFGAVQVDQSYLIVEGYLKQLWVKTDSNHGNLFNSEDSEVAIGSSYLDALETDGCKPAWALFIEDDRGLLLASAGEGCFSRMGPFISSYEHKQTWSKDVEKRRIKII